MSIEFIYFDLGNVLLSFSHERMFRQIAELTGVDAARVQQVIQQPPNAEDASLHLRFETGLIDADAYYSLVCRALDAEPPREEFFHAASDIFMTIEESVSLVRSLHAAGNRLGILSNTNIADWRFVTSGSFPFLKDCFSDYALSFEAQSMKPDRRIFDFAIETSGASGPSVFFTDDKLENVVGARAAGIDAVQFVDAEQLREELKARGVPGV